MLIFHLDEDLVIKSLEVSSNTNPKDAHAELHESMQQQLRLVAITDGKYNPGYFDK